MTMDELKQGIHNLGREDLQELATWVTLIRRSKEPGRGQEIADKLDSPDNQWVPLEELDQQLPD